MNHYVCTECGYLSQHQGVCQTDYCIQQGLALVSCHCEDGEHKSVLTKWKAGNDGDEAGSSEDSGTESSHVTTLDLDSNPE